MIVNDKVYGKVVIEDFVILDLLKSVALIRLKDISQYGVPDKYYHLRNYSRYEHSIGVMILLRKVGATLEEQVAGLLHDVSHFAFSHVADWVFGETANNSESLHDALHSQFLEKSDIPQILKKHGFSLQRVEDEHNFSLLEKSSPDLCADRVDYALREMENWYSKSLAKKCVKSIINFNGQLIFVNKQTALDFAKGFIELQRLHWGGLEAITRYHIFSCLLKNALNKKIIKKEDLMYGVESEVLKKIESSKDKEILRFRKILLSNDLKGDIPDKGRKIVKKFRYVDPLYLSDGKLIRLSTANNGFLAILQKNKEINSHGVVI